MPCLFLKTRQTYTRNHNCLLTIRKITNFEDSQFWQNSHCINNTQKKLRMAHLRLRWVSIQGGVGQLSYNRISQAFKYSNYINLLLMSAFWPKYRANPHRGYRRKKFIIIDLNWAGLGITFGCMKWPGILYPNQVKCIVSIKLTYFRLQRSEDFRLFYTSC